MHDTANSDAAIAGCLKDCGFSQKRLGAIPESPSRGRYSVENTHSFKEQKPYDG